MISRLLAWLGFRMRRSVGANLTWRERRQLVAILRTQQMLAHEGHRVPRGAEHPKRRMERELAYMHRVQAHKLANVTSFAIRERHGRDVQKRLPVDLRMNRANWIARTAARLRGELARPETAAPPTNVTLITKGRKRHV